MFWQGVLMIIAVFLGLLAIVAGGGALVLYLIMQHIEDKEYIQEKTW